MLARQQRVCQFIFGLRVFWCWALLITCCFAVVFPEFENFQIVSCFDCVSVVWGFLGGFLGAQRNRFIYLSVALADIAKHWSHSLPMYSALFLRQAHYVIFDFVWEKLFSTLLGHLIETFLTHTAEIPALFPKTTPKNNKKSKADESFAAIC